MKNLAIKNVALISVFSGLIALGGCSSAQKDNPTASESSTSAETSASTIESATTSHDVNADTAATKKKKKRKGKKSKKTETTSPEASGSAETK